MILPKQRNDVFHRHTIGQAYGGNVLAFAIGNVTINTGEINQ